MGKTFNFLFVQSFLRVDAESLEVTTAKAAKACFKDANICRRKSVTLKQKCARIVSHV